MCRFATRATLAVLAIALTTLTWGHADAQRLPGPPDFDLEELTFADLQRRMARRQDTARSLVEKYLARIDAIDRAGPTLRSVVEVNPDALAIADQLDAERRQGTTRGPLHGIPILLKDNMATADRMSTAAGSLALLGVTPPADAFVVAQLRKAGAIVLGKTNMSEWANFRSTHSTSGWSARGGLTRNPYALDHNPSGSSSGAAVAVAANMTAAALGTETDGSIVSPSNANGVVGIKPTLGLVSRFGIVPVAHSQDTAGPIARSVADAAALLAAIAGPDPEDRATKDAGLTGATDYTKFLDRRGLRGARIGVVRNSFWGNTAEVDAVAEQAIADMRRAGAIVVDPVEIPTLGQFGESEFQVLLYEFNADLNRYLAWLGARSPVRTLSDVIRFNASHEAEELAHFGQELLLMSNSKGPLTSAAYELALTANRQLSRTHGIDAVMRTLRLDALVAPTGPPAWPTDLANGDPRGRPSPSSIAAVAGYPHITVPAGFVRGLPVGISFIGRAWSEPTLIKVAYAYEQATHRRRRPGFAKTGG